MTWVAHRTEEDDMRLAFYAQDTTGEWRFAGQRRLTKGEKPNLRDEAQWKLDWVTDRENYFQGRQVRAEVADTKTVQARLMVGSKLVDSDEAHR